MAESPWAFSSCYCGQGVPRFRGTSMFVRRFHQRTESQQSILRFFKFFATFSFAYSYLSTFSCFFPPRSLLSVSLCNCLWILSIWKQIFFNFIIIDFLSYQNLYLSQSNMHIYILVLKFSRPASNAQLSSSICWSCLTRAGIFVLRWASICRWWLQRRSKL